MLRRQLKDMHYRRLAEFAIDSRNCSVQSMLLSGQADKRREMSWQSCMHQQPSWVTNGQIAFRVSCPIVSERGVA